MREGNEKGKDIISSIWAILDYDANKPVAFYFDNTDTSWDFFNSQS